MYVVEKNIHTTSNKCPPQIINYDEKKLLLQWRDLVDTKLTEG